MLEGVIRTRVGYAGGEKQDPTYSRMGDHTETVQVDYDPKRISYPQLLDVFWQSHRPSSRAWSKQYMNAVFYHNEAQHKLAIDSKRALEKTSGQKVRSKVLPVKSFTLAEGYHQKYLLKGHRRLKGELVKTYPQHDDYIASTAVTRLNGYAGGNGSREQLLREIDSLGLSDFGRKELLKMVP